MQPNKRLLLIIALIMQNFCIARFILPDEIECITESDLIFSAVVLKQDSFDVTFKIIRFAKGTASEETLTTKREFESSCYGKGSHYDYHAGDTMIIYLNNSRKFNGIMRQRRVKDGMIKMFAERKNEEGNEKTEKYFITLNTCLDAIQNFFNVFELKKRKTNSSDNLDSKHVHFYAIKDRKIYNEYIKKSIFHRNVALEAQEYIEEDSYFSSNRKRPVKF